MLSRKPPLFLVPVRRAPIEVVFCSMLNLYATVPLLAASLAVAQFVPAPTDLETKKGYAGVNVRYKQVPEGICELDPNVKSYSGYADVGQDQHVFWWFFEARNQDPSEAPLTVWVSRRLTSV